MSKELINEFSKESKEETIRVILYVGIAFISFVSIIVSFI